MDRGHLRFPGRHEMGHMREGRPAGADRNCRLNQWRRWNNSAEIGYDLARRYWGRGSWWKHCDPPSISDSKG
jgi:RimJ/RimL family protein N-acetyltransferase